MSTEKMGRPSKSNRARAWGRIDEEVLREVTIHCDAVGVDRSDFIGEALRKEWVSAANAKNRAAVRDYLSKKPKAQEAK